MQTKPLGTTDLELTPLGIGTWAIGGGGWEYGWGAQEQRDSVEAVIEGLELGLNWIDTAAVYGFGASEEAVRSALREWGRPVVIATKGGVLKAAGNRVNRHISRKTILEEVDQSLRRLGVERIDLYQLHWPTPDENIDESWETLQELKLRGKIRWAGVSNFSVPQLERCARIGPVSSLQPPYNLLRREIEDEILSWCEQHQTGVISYSPMHCGLLTGKMTAARAAALPDDDWRSPKRGLPISQHLVEPKLSHFLRLMEGLTAIAAESGHTPAQLAIAWVLRRSEVTAAIVGGRRRGQFAETIAAAQWRLSEAELVRIEEAYAEFIEAASKS